MKIVPFSSMQIKETYAHLKHQYEEFLKALPNTQKFHHIRIQEIEVVGSLLTKSSPCNTNKEANEEDCPARSVIKPAIGQFYNVKYSFTDRKGKEVIKVLSALCTKNDLEGHLFTTMKGTWRKYMNI